MSVEKVKRAGGEIWRVRWRDPQGRPHSQVVGRKGDAQALDAELKRAKRIGGTALVDNSRETLAEFAKTWWHRYAIPNLQRHTLLNYASMLDVHIVPRLGNVRLRRLIPNSSVRCARRWQETALAKQQSGRRSSYSRASSSAPSSGDVWTPIRHGRSGSRASAGPASSGRATTDDRDHARAPTRPR